MSIRTPQIGAHHGALDSGAIIASGSFSAHHHRAVARSANRLAGKGRLEAVALWPIHDLVAHGESLGVHHFAGAYAPLEWTRWASVPLAKLPNHRRLEARFTLRVTTGGKIEVQVATLGAPFSASPLASVEVAGSGAYAHADLDGIPLRSGTSDLAEVWVRTLDRGALLDTASFGAPATVSAANFYASSDRVSVVAAAASWSAPPARTWADAGHAVFFLDANGDTLVAREALSLTPSGSNFVIELARPIPTTMLARLQREAASMEIRKLPDFDFSCLALRTAEVTR